MEKEKEVEQEKVEQEEELEEEGKGRSHNIIWEAPVALVKFSANTLLDRRSSLPQAPRSPFDKWHCPDPSLLRNGLDIR